MSPILALRKYSAKLSSHDVYTCSSRHRHARDAQDEHADYTRLVDKKEKPITCCQCFQGAGFENARRPIIQCDKPGCGANWHLDCLNPPLANPPIRGWQKGYQKTKLPWVCPRHTEHDIREIQNPAFGRIADGQMLSQSAPGRTFHRMRIPRHAKRVEHHRAKRNNGRIEIINNEDDENTLRFTEMEDPHDGEVVRIPEDTVKLNFIAQAKQ